MFLIYIKCKLILYKAKLINNNSFIQVSLALTIIVLAILAAINMLAFAFKLLFIIAFIINIINNNNIYKANSYYNKQFSYSYNN